MWLLLHGGGPRPSRHLQRHPHHLPAQTGRTLLFGHFQHFTPQGLPAPMKTELVRKYLSGTWRKVLKRKTSWDILKLQFECYEVSECNCCWTFPTFSLRDFCQHEWTECTHENQCQMDKITVTYK